MIAVVFIVFGTVAWATRFEYVVMRVDPVSVIRVNRYTGQAQAYMPLDHWVAIKDRDTEPQSAIQADSTASVGRARDPYDLTHLHP
jgi:hypothetical protein